jgi:predicted dehydrogenase
MMFEASWTLNLPDEGFTVICGTRAGCDVDKKKIYTEKDGFLYDNTVNIVKDANPFEGEIRHFVDCIMSGERKTKYPIDEAITMQKIMDAIYESAATGRDIFL